MPGPLSQWQTSSAGISWTFYIFSVTYSKTDGRWVRSPSATVSHSGSVHENLREHMHIHKYAGNQSINLTRRAANLTTQQKCEEVNPVIVVNQINSPQFQTPLTDLKSRNIELKHSPAGSMTFFVSLETHSQVQQMCVFAAFPYICKCFVYLQHTCCQAYKVVFRILYLVCVFACVFWSCRALSSRCPRTQLVLIISGMNSIRCHTLCKSSTQPTCFVLVACHTGWESVLLSAAAQTPEYKPRVISFKFSQWWSAADRSGHQ